MSKKELKMPSGAKLVIYPAPFADAKNLYQSVSDELVGMKLDPNASIDVNFYKDAFCTFLSSKKLEKSLAPCLLRCTYNDLKITEEIFEPLEAREDYIDVCFEVASENIRPFTKNLFARFLQLTEQIQQLPA